MPLTTTAPRPRRFRKSLRFLSGIVLTVFVIAVLVALKTASTGLPEDLVDHLEDRFSDEVIAFEFKDVRLTPFGRASVGSIRLFQKGVPTPAMTFSGAKVRYRWTWAGGHPSVRPTRLEIREADVETLDLFLREITPAAETTHDLPEVSVDLAIRSLRFLGMPAERVRIHAACDGRRLDLTNIHANIAEPGGRPQGVDGELTLHLRPPPHPPGRPPLTRRILEGRLQGRLVPADLNPVLRYFGSESLPRIFSGFAFQAMPPYADVRFDIRDKYQRINADITGGRCLYNGVPILRLAGAVEVLGDAEDWTGVRVRGLEITRPEGRANANLHFDFRRHGVEIEASSTIDFVHLAKIADILSSVPWDSYETVGGNTATASGYYGFELSPEPSRLRGRLSAGSISFKRRVPARDLQADFSIDGDDYRFHNIRATVYGGDFNASARLWPHPDTENLMLAVTGAVEKASVGLINHDLFGGLDDDPGIANTRFDAILDMDTNTLATATGHVSGTVRGARLFRTPLFAGFTDFLASNVPGLDLLVTQDDLEASADISGNGAHFDTIRIEGPLVSISGDGTYWFSDYLDFGFRVHLFKHRTFVGKTLKYLLYPVSKLFEMEALGPLRDPSWSPTTLTLSGRAQPTDEQKYGPSKAPPGAENP